MVGRLAIAGLVLVTGCFYVDPINQRPSIDIEWENAGLTYRTNPYPVDGELPVPVKLHAVSNDPEDQTVAFQWRAYACVDGNVFSTCDVVPFDTSITQNFQFNVPGPLRQDVPEPVQSIRVVLEAKDDHGAVARPEQKLIIPIDNYAPTLKLRRTNQFKYVTDTPIDLFAEVSDKDDGAAAVSDLEWTIYSPANLPDPTVVAVDVADPDAPRVLQFGKKLTPHGDGMYKVEVKATDPLRASTTETMEFKVEPDGPPCLSVWAPLAAPTGTNAPLTEATLFQVNVVVDELDSYPTITGNALLGTTEFHWSIKQPGSSSFVDLNYDGNGVGLDPGNYAFGDIVSLRVEVEDRNHTPINCAADQDTCSVVSTSCIQRLTWHVEVR